MLETLLGLIVTICGIWLGSVEKRIRIMSERMYDTPSRKEMVENINARQEAVRTMQEEIQKDINSLQIKLDRLIQIQLEDRSS